MSLFINSFQLFERGVGIYLGGRDALMAQQVLDALQSGPVVQHRRGKGMAEHMGRALLQRRDSREVLMHDDIHLAASHPLAFVTQEEGVTVLFHHLFVTDGNEVAQHLGEFLAEGDDPLLIALARYLQLHLYFLYILK